MREKTNIRFLPNGLKRNPLGCYLQSPASDLKRDGELRKWNQGSSTRGKRIQMRQVVYKGVEKGLNVDLFWNIRRGGGESYNKGIYFWISVSRSRKINRILVVGLWLFFSFSLKLF